MLQTHKQNNNNNEKYKQCDVCVLYVCVNIGMSVMQIKKLNNNSEIKNQYKFKIG